MKLIEMNIKNPTLMIKSNVLKAKVIPTQILSFIILLHFTIFCGLELCPPILSI